jgi:orotidine-5'-phosphate decarboxylase
MSLAEKLTESAKRTGSIACFGMDPVAEKIPKMDDEGFTPEWIFRFYATIAEEMENRKIWPGAFKPNQGFYSRHDATKGVADFHGSTVLSELIDEFIRFRIPVILDAKRGDIGKSSENYAAEAFDVFEADAVTVHGYMGTDSVKPFIERGAVYVLCRTSNPGAKDLQGLMAINEKELSEQKAHFEYLLREGRAKEAGEAAAQLIEMFSPLYMHVARKILDWDSIKPGNVGAVVGATSLPELCNIASLFAKSGKKIPLLIPGVGGQGAKAGEVMAALRDAGYDLSIVRINSSSELNFAWEKEGKPEDYAGAAVRALDKLNKQIGYRSP